MLEWKQERSAPVDTEMPSPDALEPGKAQIQRRAHDENGVAEDAGERVSRAAGGSGEALPGELQAKFESSLGTDLSGVRVHRGSQSMDAAQSINARAYTVGNDIHFGSGQYVPHSNDGQHLIAHEVAHTVQQAGIARRAQLKPLVSSAGDAHELEADRAADAMVRGTPVAVSAASGVVHRKEGGLIYAPPPPPGAETLRSFGPIAAAVREGESGGKPSIPSPAGLMDTCQNNFNRYANYCTNVQSRYAGKVEEWNFADETNNKAFAKSAGEANLFCESNAVRASAASIAVSMWIPLLQSSGDTFSDAKDAAAEIDVGTVDGESAQGLPMSGLNNEDLTLEGEYLQGTVKNLLPQDQPAESPGAVQADKDLKAGKNMKEESKTILQTATNQFTQSFGAVTATRTKVVTAHGTAVGSMLAAKVAGNAKRQDADEEELAEINRIIALVDKAQSTIDMAQGQVAGLDTDISFLTAMQKSGREKISETKAADIARIILMLDGTIPQLQGDIAACTTRNENLESVIKTSQIVADGRDYTDSLVAFREALKGVPKNIANVEQAHGGFAQVANLALIERGVQKEGAAGIKPHMKVLAKLRVALAATSAAVGATNAVLTAVQTLADGMGEIPQPDICSLEKMVAGQRRAVNSAPKHVTQIAGILGRREQHLRDYVAKMEVL